MIVSHGLGGILSSSRISIVASSSSIISAEMDFFLRVPKFFFVDELGGSGRNLTLGMNRTCSVSIPSPSCGGTYLVVSSIMSIGDTVSMTDSVGVLVLEIKITMLCRKLDFSLAIAENNFSSRMQQNETKLGCKD